MSVLKFILWFSSLRFKPILVKKIQMENLETFSKFNNRLRFDTVKYNFVLVNSIYVSIRFFYVNCDIGVSPM